MDTSGKCRDAFTLVELLVAIGIIAILASLLIPLVNRVRQHAVSLQCMDNLRCCGSAMLMYSLENQSCLPYPTTTRDTTGIEYEWFTSIDPYLSAIANSKRTGVAELRAYFAIKQCPAVNNAFDLSKGSSDLGTGNQTATGEYCRSYKMNSYLRRTNPPALSRYSRQPPHAEWECAHEAPVLQH
jgi:prepilin-type N-terminal cleavage/methylation domain-containing protein